MAQVQTRLEIQQEYIIQILNQLTAEYQPLKPEMMLDYLRLLTYPC